MLKISDNNKLVLVEFKNMLLLLIVLIDFIFIGVMTFEKANVYNVSFLINYDLFVCILLFLNLIYEYHTSDDNILQFIKSHILDILAMIPYYYLFFRYLAIYRVFRLLGILNIFKLWSVRDNYTGSFKYFVHNRLLKVISLLLICYIILASVLLKHIDPAFDSVFNSLWYNVVTISSVGYGDITPVSLSGKIIGMFTIILGIMFVSVFTAAMSSVYMEKNEEDTRRDIDNKVKKAKIQLDNLTNQVNELEEKIDILNDKIDRLIDDKEE